MQPIDIAEFEDRVRLRVSESLELVHPVQQVIAPKELVADTIRRIDTPRFEYLFQLLRSVPLKDTPNRRPFRHAEFELRRNDPASLSVCQTFVQQSKLHGLIMDFPRRFRNFTMIGGFAKQNPFIAIGEDKNGVPSLSHYLPPIIEMHQHRTLLDGTHRSTLSRAVGTTAVSIYIRGIADPLPCTPIPWEEIALEENKPPLEQRYRDLNIGLFRDLAWVGIDA